MEVVLDRDPFLRGLQMVQNIVEPRQTLPILANVLLEAEGETVRLTATDLEVGARVAVPARVASPGAITVSARKLAEIVKELSAAAVALRVGENATVSLRCGGATYKLVGKGDTVGVFQLESGGMRKLLTQLRPTTFEDIIAVNARSIGDFERIHRTELARLPHVARIQSSVSPAATRASSPASGSAVACASA